MLLAFFALDVAAQTKAIIETNQGTIELELDEQKAPKTVANFVQYAEKGFYNQTIFHRVIDNFMIQGGGLTENLLQKPTDKAIINEADNGLSNLRGTIAMARTSDPHSATSQFFINLKDNKRLDFTSKTSEGWGYAVFGKVIQGQDVVDKIGKTLTTRKQMYNDVPREPIIIQNVKIIR